MSDISSNFKYHHDLSRGSCIESFESSYYSINQIICYQGLDSSVLHDYLRFRAPVRQSLNI